MKRQLYLLKALICRLLNRWQKEWVENEEYFVLESEGGSYFNGYDSLTIHWVHEYGVGRGFRRWWVIEVNDSD